MKNEKVEELLKGIVVVIDDEVHDANANIHTIIENLKKKNTPVLSYDRIPEEDIIESLYNASFIILDWKFESSDSSFAKNALPMGFGASLREEAQEEVIGFIKRLLGTVLVPIFIFTNENIEEIYNTLKENGIRHEETDRIFIEDKRNLLNLDSLYHQIGTWMENHPSAYVLKEWDKTFIRSKNEIFLKMYSLSPYWVGTIWDVIKEDASGENLNCHREFEEFLTRSITNRMDDIEFDTDCLQKKNQTQDTDHEIRQIFETERYIEYGDSQDNIPPHTGDLFLQEKKYYLNIRAECSLARKDDPELYCLEGKQFPSKEITSDIPVLQPGERMNLGSKCYEGIEKINAAIKKWAGKRQFHHGTIIEQAPEVIIPYIAGEKMIRFKLDLKIKQFSELKEHRIGRLLPPYITRVQQRCASYIVRTGVFPVSSDLFRG